MFSGIHGRWPSRACGMVLAGLMLLGVVGCGGVDPWDEIPVSGKITYEDGTFIQGDRVRLTFQSQAESPDEAVHPRPGQAEVNVADGTFSEATTVVAGDGLIPGKHTVYAFSGNEQGEETALTIVQITSYDSSGQATELTVPPPEIEVSSSVTRFEFKVKKE